MLEASRRPGQSSLPLELDTPWAAAKRQQQSLPELQMLCVFCGTLSTDAMSHLSPSATQQHTVIST